jgi:hypothetical protein
MSDSFESTDVPEEGTRRCGGRRNDWLTLIEINSSQTSERLGVSINTGENVAMNIPLVS